MLQHTVSKTPQNRSHPEQLAHSLLSCLAWEEAVHVCRANTWDGVLNVLLQKQEAD